MVSDSRPTEIPFFSQKVNWNGEDSGFPDAESIAEWESNCCGIACARMVIVARTGNDPGYWPLLQEGLRQGAYVPAGWVHRGLVDLIGRYGVRGLTHRHQTVSSLEAAATRGSLCIASVTVAFWGGQIHADTGLVRPKGGHLVLAFADGKGELLCHHPASRDEGNRPYWAVGRDRWEASFSGNFMEFPGPR